MGFYFERKIIQMDKQKEEIQRKAEIERQIQKVKEQYLDWLRNEKKEKDTYRSIKTVQKSEPPQNALGLEGIETRKVTTALSEKQKREDCKKSREKIPSETAEEIAQLTIEVVEAQSAKGVISKNPIISTTSYTSWSKTAKNQSNKDDDSCGCDCFLSAVFDGIFSCL